MNPRRLLPCATKSQTQVRQFLALFLCCVIGMALPSATPIPQAERA